MIDLYPLPYCPGVFLSCHKLADANDIIECLTYYKHEFGRVGYTGIWLVDKLVLDNLVTELPNLCITNHL